VPVNDDWSVRRVNDQDVVVADTLVSLRVADPQSYSADRWLPDDVYDSAFDAWAVARDSVYDSWKDLTDPNALQPDLPLSFREAYTLVLREGAHLGKETQIALANRLRAVPTVKVARQVRTALTLGQTPEEQLVRISQVLDEAGLTAPAARDPLPDIEKHEVRLVGWMAVKGTRE
jgi:hypothetical protein